MKTSKAEPGHRQIVITFYEVESEALCFSYTTPNMIVYCYNSCGRFELKTIP